MVKFMILTIKARPDLAMGVPWVLFIVGNLIEQAWLSSTQDGRWMLQETSVPG